MNFEDYKRRFEQKTDTISNQTCLEDVSNFFQITTELITGKSRQENIKVARMYYYFTCRYLLSVRNSLSLNLIGQLVNRDHATVINGINRFKDIYHTDKEFKDNYLTFISGVYGEEFYNRAINQLNINEK